MIPFRENADGLVLQKKLFTAVESLLVFCQRLPAITDPINRNHVQGGDHPSNKSMLKNVCTRKEIGELIIETDDHQSIHKSILMIGGENHRS